MKSEDFEFVDLYCGAGGTTTAVVEILAEAGYLDVTALAVNHWSIAIATHSANHPEIKHMCESIENVDPRKVVPSGHLNLLVASPECTHFSNARGGKPKNDQSRMSGFQVLDWLAKLDVDKVFIENVPEWMTWGPLDKDGRPIQKLKGKMFLAFVSSMEAMGYNVEHRIVCCANYGDPTTRERFFLMARKDGKPIIWPEPTHAKKAIKDMFSNRKAWVAAREIINWENKGNSIFGRDKPLCENTMARIHKGLERYSGISINKGSIDTKLNPFFTIYHGDSVGKERIRSVNEPMPTVCGSNGVGLVQPFIVQADMGGTIHSIDEPMNTVTSADARALVEPFIVAVNHGTDDSRSYSINEPMRTITSVDAWGVVEPYLVKLYGTSTVASVDDPCPTVTAKGEHIALAQPFVVNYNGTGTCHSVDKPLDTVTGKDRFGLVIPLVNGGHVVIDILYRMLEPKELAAAMSFRKGYIFAGNRGEVVKQIGNGVPRLTAKAHIGMLLED